MYLRLAKIEIFGGANGVPCSHHLKEDPPQIYYSAATAAPPGQTTTVGTREGRNGDALRLEPIHLNWCSRTSGVNTTVGIRMATSPTRAFISVGDAENP